MRGGTQSVSTQSCTCTPGGRCLHGRSGGVGPRSKRTIRGCVKRRLSPWSVRLSELSSRYLEMFHGGHRHFGGFVHRPWIYVTVAGIAGLRFGRRWPLLYAIPAVRFNSRCLRDCFPLPDQQDATCLSDICLGHRRRHLPAARRTWSAAGRGARCGASRRGRRRPHGPGAPRRSCPGASVGLDRPPSVGARPGARGDPSVLRRPSATCLLAR